MLRHGPEPPARSRVRLWTGLAAGLAAPLVTHAGGAEHVERSAEGGRREHAEHWTAEGVPPLPSWTQSVAIRRPGEPIHAEASKRSPRRGAARIGARLPVFGARSGPGCRGRWFLVGPSAWVCEEGAEPSPDEALALETLPEPTADGLPYRYFFVSQDGSFGYRGLSAAEEGVPDTQYQPGFGVAVERVEPKGGEPYGRTSHDFWVPMRDLAPVGPVSFSGAEWSEGLGWVVRDGAPVFSAPGRRAPGKPLERLTRVTVLESRKLGGRLYHRVGEGASSGPPKAAAANMWLRDADLARPERAAPPPEARPGERWIDVDLARQALVAYRGQEPEFATLVSTGKGPKDSELATPSGTFRIWVKLRTSDMDNLENVEVGENYAIEAVPWVMFFQRGYGLHGTFWHRRFGEVRSHGCVNLTPRDAERLFHWASPRLPPGWDAAFPTPTEPGTLVRVRSSSS